MMPHAINEKDKTIIDPFAMIEELVNTSDNIMNKGTSTLSDVGYIVISKPDEQVPDLFKGAWLELIKNKKFVVISVTADCSNKTKALMMLLERQHFNICFFVPRKVYDWCNDPRNIRLFNMTAMVYAGMKDISGMTDKQIEEIIKKNGGLGYIIEQLADDSFQYDIWSDYWFRGDKKCH